MKTEGTSVFSQVPEKEAMEYEENSHQQAAVKEPTAIEVQRLESAVEASRDQDFTEPSGLPIKMEKTGGLIMSCDSDEDNNDVPSSNMSLPFQAVDENHDSSLASEKCGDEENIFSHSAYDEGLCELMSKQENEATKKKTANHLKLLKSYLSTQNEFREVEFIPVAELNILLAKYIVSVRQKSGKEYEPSYLKGMMNSFGRHLRNKNYRYSIQHSPQFASARRALQTKQVLLKKMGKGNLPQRADNLTDEEIGQLYEVKQLGKHNPASVLNTLWLNNTVHFGLKSVTDHHSLTWGDVSLHTDAESGAQYLEYNERLITKPRSGEDPIDTDRVKPTMWATPENVDKCPVEIYKFYKSKRLEALYSAPHDPFYVAPVTSDKNPRLSEMWFKRQPVGHTKIACLMKSMAVHLPSSAGKRLTNHSARKHLFRKMTNSNVPSSHIMQTTGYKNVQDENNYSAISETSSARKHPFQKLTNSNVPPTNIMTSSNVAPSHIMETTGQKNVQSENNYSIISETSSARKRPFQKLTNSNVPSDHIMQTTGQKNLQSENNYSAISETSSARKRPFQKLTNSNVPSDHIMQTTGHKNVQSENNYSAISETSSARKRPFQKLTNSNVPSDHIMQTTGHKNVQSENNYSAISETSSARNRPFQKLTNGNVHPDHIMQTTGQKNVQSKNNYSAISETSSARKHPFQKLTNGNVHPDHIMQTTGQKNVQSDNNCGTVSETSSARKHPFQKLTNGNVHPDHIIQTTGQKNVQSDNNCGTVSQTQQQHTTAVLSSQQDNHISQYNPNPQNVFRNPLPENICSQIGRLFHGCTFNGPVHYNVNIMATNRVSSNMPAARPAN